MKILIVLMLGLAAASADKIVGGAVTGDPIPYQARLQYSGGSIRCGGSLIHENWVLSAAHCQGTNIQWGTWKIVLGYYESVDDEDAQVLAISGQTPHPDYNSDTIDYDCLLFHLDGTANTASNDIGIIPLPAHSEDTDDPPVNTSCTISGWGTTSSGGIVSTRLRNVSVNVIDQTVCDNRPGYEITDRMICMAASDKDACQGDSGGPAACDTGDGLKQYGIVSWGIGCANPLYPGVYSRVAWFTNWINETMDGDLE